MKQLQPPSKSSTSAKHSSPEFKPVFMSQRQPSTASFKLKPVPSSAMQTDSHTVLQSTPQSIQQANDRTSTQRMEEHDDYSNGRNVRNSANRLYIEYNRDIGRNPSGDPSNVSNRSDITNNDDSKRVDDDEYLNIYGL